MAKRRSVRQVWIPVRKERQVWSIGWRTGRNQTTRCRVARSNCANAQTFYAEGTV